MNLNVTDWKPFKIQRTESQKGLFEIENCKCGSAGELDDGSDINYIGAKKSDNGVMRSVSLDGNTNLVSKGHGIMFICDGEGSVGYTNYMDSDFIGSTTTSIGYDDALTETNAMFLVSVLDNEKFKYSYGRKYRKNLINAEIYLPIQHNTDGSIFIDDTKKYSDEGYVPDWQFMEDYIKSLHHKPLTTNNKSGQAPDLNVQNWKYFLLKDICKITMGNKMDATAMTTDNPEYNFVGRSADDNGVAMKVDAVYTENDELIEPYPAGCITVALGGSLGSTYLQKEPFYTSQNVSVLEFPKEVSDSAKLFLCTLIHNESLYKYFPFGRELNTHIRTDFGFTLPVDSDGNPDWQFMENYIKALPYGDRLEG